MAYGPCSSLLFSFDCPSIDQESCQISIQVLLGAGEGEAACRNGDCSSVPQLYLNPSFS